MQLLGIKPRLEGMRAPGVLNHGEWSTLRTVEHQKEVLHRRHASWVAEAVLRSLWTVGGASRDSSRRSWRQATGRHSDLTRSRGGTGAREGAAAPSVTTGLGR